MISDSAYFRIHMHPKRFPVASACGVEGWRSRVVHHGAEFVVASKPPGIQVPSTVDNVRESLVAKIEEVGDGDGWDLNVDPTSASFTLTLSFSRL
jgi:hypothetical protein